MTNETQWVLVPREATDEMQAAGWIDKEDVSPREIYAEMIAASPSPPAGGGEPVAWATPRFDGEPGFFTTDSKAIAAHWEADERPVQPLYTSPDAAQQRIRELEAENAGLRTTLALTEKRENGLRANMDEMATHANAISNLMKRGALRPDPETGWLEPIRARTALGGGHE